MLTLLTTLCGVVLLGVILGEILRLGFRAVFYKKVPLSKSDKEALHRAEERRAKRASRRAALEENKRLAEQERYVEQVWQKLLTERKIKNEQS